MFKTTVTYSQEYAVFSVGLLFLFFSRVLSAIGIPSLVNFIHYAIIFITYIIVCVKNNLMRISIRESRANLQLIFLLLVIIISAIINRVKVMNIVLDFLLLSQPIIITEIYRRLKNSDKERLRKYILAVAFVNLLFSYIQFFLLGYKGDDVKGIFIGMGAGHHINGAIATATAIYFITKKRDFKSYIYAIMQIMVVFLCDNKQTIAVILLSMIAVLVINIKHIKTVIIITVVVAVLIGIVYIIGTYFYAPLFSWVLNGKLQQGITAKFEIFKFINNFSGDTINAVLGYGPGMTCGRLAQILPDYKFLGEYGVEMPRYFNDIKVFQESNYATNATTGSSFFSRFFSWSGIYGDLGIVGIVVIFIMYITIYKEYCSTNISKMLFISILIHGVVFQWMEEPAFMTYFVLMSITLGQRYEMRYLRC